MQKFYKFRELVKEYIGETPREVFFSSLFYLSLILGVLGNAYVLIWLGFKLGLGLVILGVLYYALCIMLFWPKGNPPSGR